MMRLLMRGILTPIRAGLTLFSPATVLVLVGMGLTTYGLLQLFTPLAFLVPGIGFVVFGLWLAGGSVMRR